MTAYTSFLEWGFPIIALIACIAYLALFFFTLGGFKLPSTTNGMILAGTAFFNIFCSIFLFWGPLSIMRMSVHYFFYSLNSLYGTIGGKPEALTIAPIYGGIIILMSIGSYADFLNLNNANFIDVNAAACQAYFQAPKVLDRCKDDGFLTVLRVFGALAIFSTIINVVLSCFDEQDEKEASAVATPAQQA